MVSGMFNLETAEPAPGAGTGFSRRGFFKVGLGFSIALVCAAPLSGCTPAATGPAQGMAFLQAEDVALFRALMPTIASELLSLDAAEREKRLDQTLRNIDGACAAMALHARTELRKLLGLLSSPPLRWALTGVREPWSQASTQAVRAFLERWRGSRFATLNAGGMALVKLCCASYYVLPATWAGSGYPGPPAVIYQAANSTNSDGHQ